MDQAIGNGFSQCDKRERPAFAVPTAGNFRRLGRILSGKSQYFLRRQRQSTVDIFRVDKSCSVISGKMSRLDRRLREKLPSIFAEEENTAYSRCFLALMSGDDMQCLQVALRDFPLWREALGSNSEVNGFRVESRHGHRRSYQEA